LLLFLEKAAREAKLHTSWLVPNDDYESALKHFAAAILEHAPFRESFERFHARIAQPGLVNSLAQVVLKIFSPGIPDFYQGTESWDYSLVDPDNRRPVSFNHDDSNQKRFVISRCLSVPRSGEYRAIETSNAVAFMRGDVLVVVPRLTTRACEVSVNVPGRWRSIFTDEDLDPRNVLGSFPVGVFVKA
jgi:hypothetical protein